MRYRLKTDVRFIWTGFALMVVACGDAPPRPPAQNLAEYTRFVQQMTGNNARIDVKLDADFVLRATLNPSIWDEGVYSRDGGCHLLTLHATVDEREVHVSPGTQESTSSDVFRCIPPTFASPLESKDRFRIVVWDDSARWVFNSAIVTAPQIRIESSEGEAQADALQIGSWARIGAAFLPDYGVIKFVADDDPRATFFFELPRPTLPCHHPDGTTGIACQIARGPHGLTLRIPDIGEHEGVLTISGYPKTVDQCDGPDACWFEVPGPDPIATVHTRTVR